jgi:hypothetical protein
MWLYCHFLKSALDYGFISISTYMKKKICTLYCFFFIFWATKFYFRIGRHKIEKKAFSTLILELFC